MSTQDPDEPAPDVRVRFDFQLRDGTVARESDLDTRFVELAPALESLETQEGALTIADYNTDQNVILLDVVQFLVGGLCFDAVSELLAGRPFDLRLASYDQVVTLKLGGDEIVIEKDGIVAARVPRVALLAALVDCGGRFVAFRRKLRGNDDDAISRQLAADHAALQTRLAASDQGSLPAP